MMKSNTIISASLLVLASMPLASVAQTTARTTLQAENGTIEGTLIFPSSVLPAQQVCATHLVTQEEFCVETQQDQTEYALQVPSGAYHVFTTACTQIYPTAINCADGYDAKRAYYNAYVKCGLTYQCQQSVTVNDPVSIDVLAGRTHANVNPHDWYTD